MIVHNVKSPLPVFISKSIRYLRSYGLRSTLKAIIKYIRYAWERRIESSFDRKYGTDTKGCTTDMTELGVFTVHRDNATGYQGIQIPVFRKLLRDLNLDPAEYVFVDFGSGKGRALMLAAESGFASAQGVEFSPILHEIAQKNIAIFERSHVGRCPIKLHFLDAAEYSIPEENLVCFFYNPFGKKVMQKVISNIRESFAHRPRKLVVAYRNPVCAEEFDNLEFLQLVSTSKYYRIYKNR